MGLAIGLASIGNMVLFIIHFAGAKINKIHFKQK
jgi:hypothetical protein